MSEEAFSHWDCFSAQHAFEIELKCRTTHYDELLIEKLKYDALMARAAKYQTNPIYINYPKRNMGIPNSRNPYAMGNKETTRNNRVRQT
jgi:hypothetical protein